MTEVEGDLGNRPLTDKEMDFLRGTLAFAQTTGNHYRIVEMTPAVLRSLLMDLPADHEIEVPVEQAARFVELADAKRLSRTD